MNRIVLLRACLIACCLACSNLAQDFSKAVIKPSKVAGSVYMLEGVGGNIGVSIGDDGILIIDDQYAPLADKIRAALKELHPGKPKFVVNTHWHGDHTGGNESFGTEATIIAHENVRKRLNGELAQTNSAPKSVAKVALPVITFGQTASIFFNGEELKLIHFPNGHTDTDTMIYFTKSNVLHTGDHFMTGKFPFVDTSSGGSVEGIIRNVGAAIKMLPADVKIIPGHGPIATLADFKAYHNVLIETSEIVRQQIAAGKRLDEIKAAGLPDKYKEWGTGFIKTEGWLQTLYRGLGGK